MESDGTRLMAYLRRETYDKAMELAAKEGMTFEQALARVR